MKKLQLLAFYALIAPAITLGSGTLLAEQASSETADLGEQSMGQDAEPGTQSSRQGHGATKSKYNTEGAAGEQADQPDEQSKTYMKAPPAGAMVASDLMGMDLKTSDGRNAGKINDLIIDRSGRVKTVLVSSGEFLGLGEKPRAIRWDDAQMPGNQDDRRPKAPSNLTVE